MTIGRFIHLAGFSAMMLAGVLTSTSYPQDAGPVLAIIQHPVEDYAQWRRGYDAFEGARSEAGVTGAEVFQDPSDPNQVVVIHRFETIDSARSFLDSEELKDAMETAGVSAPPTITLAVRQ